MSSCLSDPPCERGATAERAIYVAEIYQTFADLLAMQLTLIPCSTLRRRIVWKDTGVIMYPSLLSACRCLSLWMKYGPLCRVGREVYAPPLHQSWPVIGFFFRGGPLTLVSRSTSNQSKKHDNTVFCHACVPEEFSDAGFERLHEVFQRFH